MLEFSEQERSMHRYRRYKSIHWCIHRRYQQPFLTLIISQKMWSKSRALTQNFFHYMLSVLKFDVIFNICYDKWRILQKKITKVATWYILITHQVVFFYNVLYNRYIYYQHYLNQVSLVHSISRLQQRLIRG